MKVFEKFHFLHKLKMAATEVRADFGDVHPSFLLI